MELVRCPNCRGMKQVAKLGGMMGACNMCLGKGQIREADKVKPVIAEAVETVNPIIADVANCVPSTTIEVKPAIEPDIKIDGKKALYKRKKA